jgi:haloalkane dehalogenase
VLPVLAAAGLRAIAPDLVGFGRSDKPVDIAEHSYARHVEWVRALAFDRLDLRGLTLVGQDWGGMIGLRLAAEHPERFAGVVAANTGLPTGDHPMPEVWWRFREVATTAPGLRVSRLVQSGCRTTLPAGVLAAYDAPFPDETYKEGARQFPTLVPATPGHASVAENLAAWKVLEAFDKPFLTAFSDGDAVTRGGETGFQTRVPGAKGQPHMILSGGHFLQEDSPAEIAALLGAMIRRRSQGF